MCCLTIRTSSCRTDGNRPWPALPAAGNVSTLTAAMRISGVGCCSGCGTTSGCVDVPRAESLLSNGGRLKVIARQFNLNPYALRRHWLGVSDSRKAYLRFGTRLSQESLQARVADERLASLDHLTLT